MKDKIDFKDRLVLIGFTLLYLLLPTDNSGIDAYAYASAIKWGNELVWPHHLLYVPFGRILFLTFPSIEPLVIMKIVNAMAAGICLYVLQKILESLKVQYANNFVFLIGSSFGFMRYAAENETYILPILFSLLGTFYFLKFINLNKNYTLILSGIFFGIGILFHQIHIFWYTGFALALFFNFKKGDFSKLIIFNVSAFFIVLSVYLLFYGYWKEDNKNFIHFVLHDVYAGQVHTAIELNNFILTPISFIRSFIQVHGYMKPLLLANTFLFILPVAFTVISFVSIKTIVKYSTKQISEFPLVSKAVFWAFLLQFLFAFYSVGNAEFMVMLPILMVLWLVLNFNIPTKPLLYLGVMFLFWNLVFGLAPGHFLDLDGSKQLFTKMEKYPDAKWLLIEPQKMENMLDYYNGLDASTGKIMRPYENNRLQKKRIKELAKKELLTNCLNNGTNFGRYNLTFDSHDFDVELSNLKHQTIDSIMFFGGKSDIDKLSVK